MFNSGSIQFNSVRFHSNPDGFSSSLTAKAKALFSNRIRRILVLSHRADSPVEMFFYSIIIRDSITFYRVPVLRVGLARKGPRVVRRCPFLQFFPNFFCAHVTDSRTRGVIHLYIHLNMHTSPYTNNHKVKTSGCRRHCRLGKTELTFYSLLEMRTYKVALETLELAVLNPTKQRIINSSIPERNARMTVGLIDQRRCSQPELPIVIPEYIDASYAVAVMSEYWQFTCWWVYCISLRRNLCPTENKRNP